MLGADSAWGSSLRDAQGDTLTFSYGPTAPGDPDVPPAGGGGFLPLSSFPPSTLHP